MTHLSTAQNWIIRIIVALLPLAFLTFTPDFFDINKLALLVFGTLIAVLLWGISQLNSEFRFKVTPYDLPVLLLAIAFMVSAILVTPNAMDAFVFPGTTSVILFGTVLYFLIVQQIRSEREEGSILTSFLLGTAIAAFISVLSGIGLFGAVGKSLSLPVWLQAPTFNTLGGVLPAITLFVALLPLLIGKIMTNRSGNKFILNVVFLVLLVAGLTVTAYQAFPGKPASPRLLPVSTGWSIALETLKRNPILGVGSGNFVEAFSRFRPVEFNNTDVWNLRFVASSNWYFHVWTVTGLLGLVALLWIVFKVLRAPQTGGLTPVHYSLLTILVLFLLVPANLPLLVAFYILLALVAEKSANELSLQFTAQGREHSKAGAINLVAAVLTLVALGGLIYTGLQAKGIYAAEGTFKKAVEAAGRNDGKVTYETLISAIQQNPRVDRYRTTYSQINLALANNLATKKDLSEDERKTVSQLVQQAIREAQAGVSLNQTHSENWSNLAGIYQALFPLAKGADQFAISSFSQAIALDPVNPLLRVSLGQVYYSLNKYEDAVKVFELAVASKPDFANAHYNLAVALRDKGDTARAAQEMQAALNLITASSQDYSKVQKELNDLQKKLSEASKSAQQTQGTTNGTQAPLQGPNPAPSPAIQPRLDLPAEAAPPTPKPEPSPTPGQ